MHKAWHQGLVEFDNSTIHLFPDLSQNNLYMRCVVCHLLDLIRQAGATYTWGHPFSIQVTRGTDVHPLRPWATPLFFIFLNKSPIPNWLDPSRWFFYHRLGHIWSRSQLAENGLCHTKSKINTLYRGHIFVIFCCAVAHGCHIWPSSRP